TFFLPTLHEWTKAAYYDPDRHGPGEEGYWLYPDGGEEPLTSGFPWEPGAETSGGIREYVDVGQYPQSVSPWGLLDVSGGEREWTETVVDGSFSRARHIKGSEYYDVGLTDLFDRLDFVLQTIPTGITGIRGASVAPAPGTPLPLVA